MDGVTFPAAEVRVDFVDPADPDAFARAVRQETRMIYVETPTNPTMLLADLAVHRTFHRVLDGRSAPEDERARAERLAVRASVRVSAMELSRLASA